MINRIKKRKEGKREINLYLNTAEAEGVLHMRNKCREVMEIETEKITKIEEIIHQIIVDTIILIILEIQGLILFTIETQILTIIIITWQEVISSHNLKKGNLVGLIKIISIIIKISSHRILKSYQAIESLKRIT